MNYGMDYQGGGGGGGFGGSAMESSPASGGRGGGGGGRRSADEQTLIPVTVRMALSATSGNDSDDGSLQLEDGRKVYHVRIVGAIRSFEDMSTNDLFQVEDGTGLIEVKKWLDDNQECTAMTEMKNAVRKENLYVKVIGQLKEYQDKKTIIAESIRPLRTGNELTHHMLEVVYSSESCKRKNSIVAPNAGMMMGMHGNNSGVGFGARGGAGVPLQQAGGGGGGHVVQQVLAWIRKEGDHTDVGASLPECIRSMAASGQYTEQQIRGAIEQLSEEGHLYSTIDEEHVKYAE